MRGTRSEGAPPVELQREQFDAKELVVNTRSTRSGGALPVELQREQRDGIKFAVNTRSS
jgi:hypothetical protein